MSLNTDLVSAAGAWNSFADSFNSYISDPTSEANQEGAIAALTGLGASILLIGQDTPVVQNYLGWLAVGTSLAAFHTDLQSFYVAQGRNDTLGEANAILGMVSDVSGAFAAAVTVGIAVGVALPELVSLGTVATAISAGAATIKLFSDGIAATQQIRGVLTTSTNAAGNSVATYTIASTGPSQPNITVTAQGTPSGVFTQSTAVTAPAGAQNVSTRTVLNPDATLNELTTSWMSGTTSVSVTQYNGSDQSTTTPPTPDMWWQVELGTQIGTTPAGSTFIGSMNSDYSVQIAPSGSGNSDVTINGSYGSPVASYTVPAGQLNVLTQLPTGPSSPTTPTGLTIDPGVGASLSGTGIFVDLGGGGTVNAGSGSSIFAGANNIIVNGYGPCGTIFGCSGDAYNGSASTVTVVDASAVTVSGNTNAVTAGIMAAIDAIGNNNIITGGTSDTITNTGSGDIDTLGAGSTVTETGTGSSVIVNGNNLTVSVDSTSDTLTLLGSSDTGYLYGTGDVGTAGSGTNDELAAEGSSQTISLSGAYDSGTITGSNDIGSLYGTSDTGWAGNGTADQFNANGANETITLAGNGDSGGLNGVGDAGWATGSSDSLYANSGGSSDTISLTGSSDTFGGKACSNLSQKPWHVALPRRSRPPHRLTRPAMIKNTSRSVRPRPDIMAKRANHYV